MPELTTTSALIRFAAPQIRFAFQSSEAKCLSQAKPMNANLQLCLVQYETLVAS
jgi:hypothetical protein